MKSKDIKDIAIQSIGDAIDSLQLVKDSLGDEFVDAVKLLNNSNKIIVSGVGKSGLIAQKISATFLSIGLQSHFLHPVEALHGDIGMVSEGDTAILLSKSGGTDELVRLIPFLKSRNVKLIAIVSNLNSYLATNADIVLNGSVTRESCPFNIAPTTSTLVALAIGDALAVSLMKVSNLTVADFSKNHPLGQIGRNLTLQVKDIMHKNSALPMILANAYFKDAVVEISNKGLGCVCIVDSKGILKGIITDGDIRRVFQKIDDIRGLKVESVMNINPITIKSELYLGDALAIMENRESQISVLPVIDNNKKCIGLIRLHDIVRSGI